MNEKRSSQLRTMWLDQEIELERHTPKEDQRINGSTDMLAHARVQLVPALRGQ